MKKNILRKGTGVKKRHVLSLQVGNEEKLVKDENENFVASPRCVSYPGR